VLTSVPDLSLGMAAADSGIGVKYMELAEDGEWQGREQFSYQRGWMVSPGDGVRQMAVRFWDGAGNVSPIYTETVVLDTTPPTWDDACATDGGSVYIGVQDRLSGLVSSSVEYELATGMETDWSSWQPADCSGPDGSTDQQVVGASPTVPAGSTIRFRAMDRAGNWSVSPACALHGAWN
jgi:hypothetical protein